MSGQIGLSFWLWALLCSLPVFAETLMGKVVGVHDGDTCTVLDANHTEHKIRLAGVDAPELGQAFSQASKQNLSNLIFGKFVSVSWKKKHYKRLVGIITFDGRDINLDQLRTGLAWFYRQYANELDAQRRAIYDRAEAEARTARRGLWAGPAPTPPWAYRHPDVAAGPKAGNSTPTPISAGGKIIGNRNSNIYHRPDCPDYSKVSERNRVYFATEAEAERAGFRRARNCHQPTTRRLDGETLKRIDG